MNPFDLKSVLLAKHAQHVALVHFPIALIFASVAFDLLSLRKRNLGSASRRVLHGDRGGHRRRSDRRNRRAGVATAIRGQSPAWESQAAYAPGAHFKRADLARLLATHPGTTQTAGQFARIPLNR